MASVPDVAGRLAAPGERAVPKIILDCDPGHDDAFALALAHGDPGVELLAVTTVAGNQTLEKVTRNALAVATVCGISGVPIAAGAAKPLVRRLMTAPGVHGESGLDGVDLPEPTVALDPRHAVDVIVEAVMGHAPGEVTLVPTGPLTNIALALARQPAIADHVAGVVLMGGAARGGNWTPAAEFNIAVDPEAARAVFTAPWPVTMVGLDTTHQALATPQVLADLDALGTAPGRFLAGLLRFYGSSYATSQHFTSPPVHDPCAVAHVLDPTLLTVRRAPIDVELHGELTAGMTVVDLRADAPDDCTTSVALGIDAPRFWERMLDAVRRLGDPPAGAR